MRATDLQQLYDYSYSANAKLFVVMNQLTPEQFTQPVAGSYESLRNTLVHILSAEWGWLDRCGGPPRGEKLKPEDYPTLDSVIVVWARVEAHVRAFLSGLTDEDVTRPVEFVIGAGPKQSLSLGDLMTHGFVHGAHHRGQIALLLRMLGVVPGNVDYLFYAGDKRV
jgi:uncharacterized damage-inducible protein DinB